MEPQNYRETMEAPNTENKKRRERLWELHKTQKPALLVAREKALRAFWLSGSEKTCRYHGVYYGGDMGGVAEHECSIDYARRSCLCRCESKYEKGQGKYYQMVWYDNFNKQYQTDYEREFGYPSSVFFFFYALCVTAALMFALNMWGPVVFALVFVVAIGIGRVLRDAAPR